MSFLDRIARALSAPKISTAALSTDIAAAKSLVVDIETELARLEGQRPQMILKGDADREAHSQAIDKAKGRLEYARLGVEQLEAKRQKVEADEAKEHSIVEYEKWRAASSECVQMIKVDWAQVIRLATGLLRKIDETNKGIDYVNAHLPAGAAPIPYPEQIARGGKPARPKTIVSDTVGTIWCSEFSGLPLPAHLQGAVTASGTRGFLPATDFHPCVPHCSHPVHLREFQKVISKPAIPAVHIEPLAHSLRLPALIGNEMIWDAKYPFVEDGHVAETLDKAENSQREQRPAVEPPNDIEFIPVDSSSAV